MPSPLEDLLDEKTNPSFKERFGTKAEQFNERRLAVTLGRDRRGGAADRRDRRGHPQEERL